MTESPAYVSPGEMARIKRLEYCGKAATWWILGLGILHLMGGEWIAGKLGLRFHPMMLHELRGMGMAELALGIFLRKSLAEPENQYFTLDVLILYLLAHPIVLLLGMRGGLTVLTIDWFYFALNTGLGAALILFRTRSSKMVPGAAGARDAKVATKETISWLKTLVEEKKRQRPLESKDDKPTRRSVAAPHMD